MNSQRKFTPITQSRKPCFTRKRGLWYVRGPKCDLIPGSMVKVHLKNGDTTDVILKHALTSESRAQVDAIYNRLLGYVQGLDA